MSQKCNPGSWLFSLIYIVLYVGTVVGVSKLEISNLCDSCWVINIFIYPLFVLLCGFGSAFCIFCLFTMKSVIERLLRKMLWSMSDKETDCIFPFETSDSLET